MSKSTLRRIGTAILIAVALVTYIGHVSNRSYARGYDAGVRDAITLTVQAQSQK